ncbi:hypothetical protein [Paenibacillus pinihumi]|uniref:hypothetical protein n=1 Tax=Paenibacillus pinihumi TaxID=669462 RepID=UPI000490C82F|nr:hypothetical protein [Paenibacillus pinihumi]
MQQPSGAGELAAFTYRSDQGREMDRVELRRERIRYRYREIETINARSIEFGIDKGLLIQISPARKELCDSSNKVSILISEMRSKE